MHAGFIHTGAFWHNIHTCIRTNNTCTCAYGAIITAQGWGQLEILECAKPLNFSRSRLVETNCVQNAEVWDRKNLAIAQLTLEVDSNYSKFIGCDAMGEPALVPYSCSCVWPSSVLLWPLLGHGRWSASGSFSSESHDVLGCRAKPLDGLPLRRRRWQPELPAQRHVPE